MMGKASSRKRRLHNSISTGRFEAPGPLNDTGIRNYAITTTKAIEHLLPVFQLMIDEGDFSEARAASMVAFVLSSIKEEINEQLAIGAGHAVDSLSPMARAAKLYPLLCRVDGNDITLVERRSS